MCGDVGMEQCDVIQRLRRACRASLCSTPHSDLVFDRALRPPLDRAHNDFDTSHGLKSNEGMLPLLQENASRAQGLDRMPTRIQLDISNGA